MLIVRLLFVSGIVCAALGAGAMFPALVGWLARGELGTQGSATVEIGLVLVVGGIGVIGSVLRRLRQTDVSIPAPVRAVMAANILFLAFCALELSDGLLFRGGRVLYWTTYLFVPAMVLLYGQALAQAWAWWVARVLTALSALWFLAFIALIPFANLRSDGVPVPWYGRLYMAGVSLVFAGIAAYAFRSLGQAEARRYFGLARDAGSTEALSEASLARGRAG